MNGDERDGEQYIYKGPPTVDPTKLTTDAVNQAKEDFRRELEANHVLAMAEIARLWQASKYIEEAQARIRTELATDVTHSRQIADLSQKGLQEHIDANARIAELSALTAKETAQNLSKLKETVDQNTYTGTGQTLAESTRRETLASKTGQTMMLLFSGSVLLGVIDLIINLLKNK